MSQTATDDFKNLRRLGSGCTTAFCGLFAIVGLFFSGLGVRAAWWDHASAVWPRVPGQITRSEVKETSDSDGNTYRPDVGYRYLVDGREFTGKCISFGIEGFSGGQRFARQYVRRYPVGAVVEVAYQPGQPAVSALETGLTRRSFVNVVMGLFLGAAGTYMAWLVGHHELLQPPGVRPFLLFLPALLWFGMFFGFLYWSSIS